MSDLRIDECSQCVILKEALNDFKIKDMERAERLASIGSQSSSEISLPDEHTCCSTVNRIINYLLERGEQTRRQDEIIQSKSYAGFYYFIKWFIRALFLLFFTTLGTIGGKEVGCEIKNHSACNSSVVDLAGNSPHIIASVLGSIFGLLAGQWLGRLVWDSTTLYIRRCLRKVEKWADRTKFFLFIFSVFIYLGVTTLFATIFWLFVDFKKDSENIIGAVMGGILGLILAALAYRKSSSCRSGEETPMIKAISADDRNIPELVL